jgi:molecular chaperone DnaJ
MSQNKRDYYEVLGVDRNASSSEIKKAYRRLAKQYHPDKYRNKPQEELKEAEAKFKEASEAFEILSDQDKRHRYDQFGHEGVSGMRSSGFSGFEDIFPDLSDIFSFFTGGRSSHNRSRRRGPKKGSDLQMQLDITLEEAYTGTEASITPPTLAQCPTCMGSGAKQGTQPEICRNCDGRGEEIREQRSFMGIIRNISTCSRCGGTGQIVKHKCPTCHGRGRIKQERKIKLKIPAGFQTGQHLRVRGEGGPGELGGESGDLYIVVNVKDHKIYERQDDHLIRRIYLPIHIATLGGEMEIPHIDGSTIKYKFPAGVQNQQIFELPGYGMPHVRSGEKGNLYLQAIITPPKKLNKEQKKLMQELGQKLGNYTDGYNRDPSKIEKSTSSRWRF